LVKLNGGARGEAVRILAKVRTGGAYADDLLQDALCRSGLEQSDRALLSELVHGTLRWRGQLDWVLARFFKGDFAASPSSLQSILEIGLYQLRFLDRIPTYAAVSQAVALAKDAGGARWGGLVNAVLRRYLREGEDIEFPDLEKGSAWAISVRYSHPQWMIERWLRRFGTKRTVEYCKFNNSRPRKSLRISRSKMSVDAAVSYLTNLGVEVRRSAYFDDFLLCSGSLDVAADTNFVRGCFSVQDESTAIASTLLRPQQGDTILDMCAAPGGKTCHLTHLSGDSARIVAVDVQFDRLLKVRENAMRLDLKSILPVQADARRLEGGRFDKILLDAPCSGLGVLSRRSDLRWRKGPDDIRRIASLQRDLLSQAAGLLAARGTLVYSTCTLEKEETNDVVRQFLQENDDFRIDAGPAGIPHAFRDTSGCWLSYPFQHSMDGTFAVRLVRKAG